MQNEFFFNKDVMREVLCDNLIEKRRARRWGIFFKILLLLFVLFISIFIISCNNKNVEHVGIVDITGLISDKSNSNAKCIIMSLNAAFSNKYSKAIILKINSPGGTPVQSNIIHNHIKKLRKMYPNKPVYAVIEDIGTSGAYLIAVAAEKIYCDSFSIVGSIGVLINSFGFSEAINKLGIERRIYKAGKNKVIMDPFLERNSEDEKILQYNLNIMHENFIEIVKKNRYKNSIPFDESDIFSGKFWVGKDALFFGLVDGFSDVYTLSSDVIKIPFLVDYNNDPNILNLISKRIKN
ncbi:MAG TPA: S49 family peptidase [Candidatus Azoamicus sp.]